MLSTCLAYFGWISNLGSHIAAIAALCTQKSPLLHFSISSSSASMSVLPNFWSAMATASRVRQRGSLAKRRNLSSTSLFPAASNSPCPSTPQKARNSAGELVGALSGSKERKCSNNASFPSSATACASSIFPLGPGRPDSLSRNGSQSISWLSCWRYVSTLLISLFYYTSSNGRPKADSKFT